MPAVRQRPTRSPDSRGVKIWVVAQLSPAIAEWLTEMQGVDASALRDLGLRDAEDSRIFFAAPDNLDHLWEHLEREASGDPRGSLAGGGSTPDCRREADRDRWPEPGGC